MKHNSILVVDDDSESLLLLTEILTSEGYNARPANSGYLAIASANAYPPQLILLDIRMPGLDGFEVCRRLKASDTTRDVPLIFISASKSLEERVAAFAFGAVDYIEKPFLREELLARVRTHVELGRLRTDLEMQVAERTLQLNGTIGRLRESEERFRNMADTAPVMIWVSAPDKLCSFFNRGWLDFTGRTLDQELANGWTEGVHPDDLDRCFQVYATSFDDRRSFEMEYRLRRHDGEYRWILDRGAPSFSSAGEFRGYIGSAIDISDLKRAQEEDLSREKLECLAVLTRGIAHDFNNLMGSILAEAEVAETDLAAGIAPRNEIQQIKKVAIRSSEIVRELMLYSGQERPSFEAVHLSGLVEEMLELLKASISKHATLHVDLSRDVPAVRGNPTQLRQMVMNLIINASQALGEKAGTIHVKTSFAGAIRAFPHEHDSSNLHEWVRLEISDSGCGMTEEERLKIFDPFFTRKPGGHGLGLAVVHGIVASHEGCVSVVSQPGKGTTFEVLLLRAEAAAEPLLEAASVAVPAELSLLCRTILLVEDEDTLQLATSKALRKRGLLVLVAADGWSAVETFQAHVEDIGVVLLDLTLPGIPGREVLRQIRGIKPDVKVVLTSAYDQKTPLGIAPGERALTFLRKPYGVADLVRGLEAACTDNPRDIAV